MSHTNLVLQRAPPLRVVLTADRAYRRSPLGKFACPVRHCRERYDDEERPALALGLNQEGDQRDRLDCFAETLEEKEQRLDNIGNGSE